MKVVFISDTHGQHNDLNLPEGDLLLHSGDLSGRGREEEIDSFLDWFAAQPHAHKVFIAGNHDFYFERQPEAALQKIPKGVIYLNDSGVEINGIHLWGSPIQPTFFDWAFNRDRGAEIKKHWDLIPANTDILITHGPPYGILDKTTHGDVVGCEELLECVNRICPSYHLFGHIHEAYGLEKKGQTTFINGSVLNERYYLVNDPVVFEV